ncbi:Putative transmembrane protein (Alph_Pro_TM) [Tritonibacter multivorans]|uniref:Putative transmembrane protein (Alph_Pro_TM) n=1 Tax=Tritonibacter multivorans TaxID=928856 RepID=A0A0P1GKM3_9RHOB|nr:TIGR02186 family protein [Tritonibacter multivorans]MDA7419654.1 TIGR02186 family protein [Tritonibacter multivorans]CUH75915.1 Putative transmembrane protein (Alph_Pro_TM) [Tritonibacter multivorans]SFC58890.1 conserved hypothetical protein [Tritonibacter multivorans]
MRRLLSLLAICLPLLVLSRTATAEEVVLGLSQDQVAITATFNGSEILIFGAVKRESPLPDGAPLEVLVTVSGPQEPVMVRRKAREAGIWVNTDAVLVDHAPSFYTVATSAPLTQVLSDTEDLRHDVSIRRAIRLVGAGVEDGAAFSEAVIRIRENRGLYSLRENTVAVDQQTLFRTALSMPADLTEGLYATRIFLTRGGEVVSHYETTIEVSKVGLERFLFNLSRQQPVLYGILALVIASLAGWGASAVFQALRQR